MKIFDMHVHAKGQRPTPEKLLAELGKAGVYGCCIFSTHPKENLKPNWLPFEERLKEVLEWSRGYEERIFPFLWVHPYEENIIEKVNIAAKAGVAGFKMVCANYYVYEDKSIELLTEIARLGKPVVFHSGILWNGQVSSDYNRPLNWEALLKIKGLRFSMGHCSWPWIDECIAMYGKFLNTLIYSDNGAEMFFDITPGTPEIYRKELLTKLYNIGYDVGDNVMFGTDCVAFNYRSEWTSGWLKTDAEILDDLGVSLRNRQKLYYENLLRFIGRSDDTVTKSIPEIDDNHAWSPVNPEVKTVIEKWYNRLKFPKCYDKEFKEALDAINISDAITAETYEKKCTDGKRNLLSFLFMCEQLDKNYSERGIPSDILDATLKDIVIWTKKWSTVKGELYLGELGWLQRHMSLKIFRIGRLQFCMGKAEQSIDTPNIKLSKGDDVLEIHIPEDGKLDIEECKRSILLAKEFFANHFPEFNSRYSYFTCHSWLLDESLKKYLNENSNILRFAELFEKVAEDETNELIRYLFKWNTNEVSLAHEVSTSAFAERIKQAVLRGEIFHETLGIIKK